LFKRVRFGISNKYTIMSLIYCIVPVCSQQLAETIRSSQVILWPVHVVVNKRGHWILCVVYTTLRCVAIIDSLSSTVSENLSPVRVRVRIIYFSDN
jgi:hypothetical protein